MFSQSLSVGGFQNEVKSGTVSRTRASAGGEGLRLFEPDFVFCFPGKGVQKLYTMEKQALYAKIVVIFISPVPIPTHTHHQLSTFSASGLNERPRHQPQPAEVM